MNRFRTNIPTQKPSTSTSTIILSILVLMIGIAPTVVNAQVFFPQVNITNSNTTATSSSTPNSTLASSSKIPQPPAVPLPGRCHLVNLTLPDPKCTPGMINPNVTQQNIKNTICTVGYTKTIRPPTSYTNPLKLSLMKSYNLTAYPKSVFELDHLVPLEIGGNPTSVKNLWPEPHVGNYTAGLKDNFENFLHKNVCNGKIPLATAQRYMATNWVSNWMKFRMP